jgi:ubiquinone biosynthesis accessory factor UbiJ
MSAPSIEAMSLAAKPFAATVNHLLAREDWARERLMAYAGHTARVIAPPVTLTIAVQADGYLAAGENSVDTPCNVTITLAEGATAAFLRGGQAAVMKHVRIEGDAEFAADLSKLAEHLRWDPEEDLSRLIGDAPAAQAAGLARDTFTQARRAGRSVLESLVEYWLEEDPQLVRQSALADFRSELVSARDALARLEKRLERLEARRRPAVR